MASFAVKSLPQTSPPHAGLPPFKTFQMRRGVELYCKFVPPENDSLETGHFFIKKFSCWKPIHTR
ncbi:hypothetical protein NQ317_000949 [Molorchus minor]|uniref:Uncharacterized protein n=1 Tax=Molorchus minor TaxID=1323400 RepID=A0ABQ9JST4_9CUCU|nr:hypothetical protein NQ317_000949 [Molorchus minor]